MSMQTKHLQDALTHIASATACLAQALGSEPVAEPVAQALGSESVAEPVVEQEQPVIEHYTDPEPAPEQPKVTTNEVRGALIALSEKKGRYTSAAVLESFNAAKLSDVAQDDYPLLMAAIEEASKDD